jgi:hypothetical protein
VAWYTGRLNGQGSEYVEIRDDGRVSKVPGVPLAAHERITGFAITGDGGTYVSIENNSAKSWSVKLLDPASLVWRAVTFPGFTGRITLLYGGDSNRVVTVGNQWGIVRFLRTGP